MRSRLHALYARFPIDIENKIVLQKWTFTFQPSRRQKQKKLGDFFFVLEENVEMSRFCNYCSGICDENVLNRHCHKSLKCMHIYPGFGDIIAVIPVTVYKFVDSQNFSIEQ